jgi:MoaA/NifB/PqqE/SkfB family radical SAM enzyme
MKSLVKIRRNVDIFSVYWTLTDFCNFKCSYCPPKLNAGTFFKSDLAPTDEQILQGLERLKLFSAGKLLTVTLSGGEPTTHRMFPTIIDYINSMDGFSEVITNGSRPLTWWEKLQSLPKSVVISLHPEFTDLEKVNQLGLYLKSKNVVLKYNLMADPEKWEWVSAVHEKLDVSLHRDIDTKILTNHGSARDLDDVLGKHYKYTQEQLDFIKTATLAIKEDDPREALFGDFDDGTSSRIYSFRLVAKNLHKFKGWRCGAGSTSICISAKGTVHGGICNVVNLGPLEKFVVYPGNVLCKFENCFRAQDISIPKYNPSFTSPQGQ